MMFNKVKKVVSRHKFALASILLINLFILAFGYFLRDPVAQETLATQLDDLEHYFTVFGVLRIALEVYLYLNWRGFVVWCKHFFNLGYRKTWFVLQCKSIFKLFLIFDIATFVMLSFF